MNILDFVKIETSTVDDGNMSYSYGDQDVVDENKKRFFKNKGFNYNNTYLLRTNFKKLDEVKVLETSPKDFKVVHDVDSIITNSREVVLALLTADCLQITLYDTKNSVLALIHAGFRWQNGGIIDRTFEILQNRYRTQTNDVLVHLGNCISVENYSWDSNILNHTNEGSWIRKTIKKDDHPKRPYTIDIKKAAKLNLKDIGVLQENILDSNIDCYSDMNYFSHVRSVYSNEKDGRHITVVQMK